MKKSLIIFENHFEDKTTLVFQYNNEKYVINGCQVFYEERKDSVFKLYKVKLKYQNDVNEALASLNDNIDNKELLYIIRVYPSFIDYIKHENQTYEMALAILEYTGSLKDVNKDLQDDNMVSIAIKMPHGWDLKYIREDLQTYEMVLKAVKDWCGNIRYARKDLQTYEMVLDGVKMRGYILQYIREDLQTEELCEIALKCSIYNIQYIKCPVMKNKFA